MHDHESPDFRVTDPDLAAFEARLGTLAPNAQLDRDRLMFAAGRRAAGKRLRTINRMLVGASLALAGVAFLPLLSRESGTSDANPRTNLASHNTDESHLQRSPIEPSSIALGDEISAALAKGPTSQRLLREWEQNGQSFDRPVDQPPDAVAMPMGDVDSNSSNTSRELLLRYLQPTGERL